MKMKINKACDLSSISVLPPQSRRTSQCSGPDSSSIFNRNQGPSQLRSQQQSQQSFSQGISSQHGIFSQLSQNSQDEILTNDQRFGSQERENSTKRISCLPPVNFTREESQMQLSRSSTNIMPTRKWGSNVPDQRCQISEQLEHRMGMIETSLSRFGMILDSVQGDIMHVNKGTKEITLEMESIRHKLTAYDNSLQTINKAQEDFIARLDGGLKLISDQVTQSIQQGNTQEISLLLSALPEKIEAFISKVQNNLSKTFSNEIQTLACSLKEVPIHKNPTPTVISPKALACSLKVPRNENPTPTIIASKVVSYRALSHDTQSLKHPAVQRKVQQVPHIPKVEMGNWTSVKPEKAILTQRDSNVKHIQRGKSPTELKRELRVVIESDEEIDGGFSCLLKEKETVTFLNTARFFEDIGNYTVEEAAEETERILRKARRRKRKHSNTIIID